MYIPIKVAKTIRTNTVHLYVHTYIYCKCVIAIVIVIVIAVQLANMYNCHHLTQSFRLVEIHKDGKKAFRRTQQDV